MRNIIYAIYSLIIATASSVAFAQNTIRVYNYDDFIDHEIIANFERETGIKVEYRVYDTDHEARSLFESNTVADVIVPSHFLLKQLIANNKIKPLDRSKIPNYANINPDFLLKLQEVDPNNRYATPYLWLVTGIAINEQLAKKALGTDVPHSWSLIFDDAQRTKLANCGISLLEAPIDFYDAMLDYKGINIDSVSVAKIQNTSDSLSEIKKSIKYVDQHSYIDDLNNNNLCVAMAYSGDIIRYSHDNDNVKIITPDDKALLTITTTVIPNTATNVDGAHAFINYLLNPRVAAKLVNSTGYGTAVNEAKSLVRNEFKDSELLFPDRKIIRNFNLMKTLSSKQQKVLDQVWANTM